MKETYCRKLVVHLYFSQSKTREREYDYTHDNPFEQPNETHHY